MKNPVGSYGFFLVLLVAFLGACSVTKNFAPNENLLIKNKFRIENRKISQDDLSGYIQQTPNQKLFGLFRPNIALYNSASKGKDTKFKKWVRTKLGSAPVILDTTLNVISIKQMSVYLSNKGYFGNSIKDSVVFHKNHKATVYYLVKTPKPYTVRNITYSIADTFLAGFVMKDTAKSLIKRGKNYDSYLITDERTRIATALNNQGFYRFSSSFIFFHVDSSFMTRELDITVEIRNPPTGKHHRYFINNIYVYPEFDLLQADTLSYDTLMRTYKSAGSDTTWNTYYFLFNGEMTVKTRTIAQAIIIRSGTPFNVPATDQTYTNLSGLQVYKFVNITFHEVPVKDSLQPHLLDCKIQLSRSQSQTFSVSTDGTNSSGAFGVQGTFSSQHRNVFGGAQLLRLNLTASAQMQGNINSSNLLNTIELGANASLTFPQFLIPIKPERFSKTYRPRTMITVGYNYQKQPDYDRHLTNATFGYNWNQNQYIKHILNPVELSFVKIFPDSVFQHQLDTTTDKRLKNQYTNHTVAGLKYTITFSNQNINLIKDFIYIRSNIETGGNLIYLANNIFNTTKTENGSYNIFGTPYAQYVRPDFDIRYYHVISGAHTWVGRFYGGVGVAYGNSTTLPFEKAFFAGGANDLRGWRMGTLGPGSFKSDTVVSNYDQTGDMQLQINFEYRFPIYSFFRSALFVDAGNIWLLKDSQDYPGGKFTFSTFLPQVAIDVGLGVRLDFDFFIFRLDPAIPIRMPSANTKGHWYFDKLQLSDITWNFGIGYPF